MQTRLPLLPGGWRIYRPVRERNAGHDIASPRRRPGACLHRLRGVAHVALSSTDHSTIVEQLRRLNRSFHGTGKSVSLPSQRVDAFGVELARLIAGEKGRP